MSVKDWNILCGGVGIESGFTPYWTVKTSEPPVGCYPTKDSECWRRLLDWLPGHMTTWLVTKLHNQGAIYRIMIETTDAGIAHDDAMLLKMASQFGYRQVRVYPREPSTFATQQGTFQLLFYAEHSDPDSELWDTDAGGGVDLDLPF